MVNNMVCDIYSGVCKPNEESEIEAINLNIDSPNLTLYYVTDPMCSHCWAFEPTLNKLLVQYRHLFNFQMVMGGLLEEWGDGPIDPANGIYKPADVTPHWQEVGKYSRMPIDGTIMEIDPVQSSYPASRLYKAIQQIDSPTTAIEFIRLVREAVFVFNQNISNPKVLKSIVQDLYKNNETINTATILDLANSKKGQELLQDDFNLVRQLGVRGFPTIVIVNSDNQGTKIVGGRDLNVYISAIETLNNNDKSAPKPLPDLGLYLKAQHRLFSKEIEFMYNIQQGEVAQFITHHLDPSTYVAKNMLGEDYYETTLD